jgi:BolA protein
MSIQESIETKLAARFHPLHCEVVNESHMHSVPPGSESHFKITLVSEDFAGRRLIERHRAVNETLAVELSGSVHAIALHTLTPEEWFERGGAVPDSPPCLGGSKAS